MIMQAIKTGRATSIWSRSKTMRLRYRIDGVPVDATRRPSRCKLALASRFKIMSNLDIADAACPRTDACASSQRQGF